MLFASRVWMFDSSGLQALEGFAHIMPSPLVWLWTRPISHLVLALFIALPFIFAMRNHLADLKGFAAFGGCMTTLFLAGCALCSLLINIAYLPCSLWITLDLSLLMISLVAKMKRVSNHR
ncbi:MAG: hypothetical protein M9910_10355 [Kiritimatiellae bacterium]|nr:hypothetical protein [Kiritimatiellia bacterium]